MTTRFFTAGDGARLAFRDEGAGLAVLCLPGLTRTMADFDYMMAALVGMDVPPLRLIRMDCRGRGESAWTGPATYTVAQETQDAVALLDHLGVDRAAVIGTSRGGLIGLAMAVMAPGRLIGLCLNDVGPVIERPGLERIFDYLGRNPPARTHDELAAKLSRQMRGFANVPDSRWLEEARKHYTETPQGLRITYDPALRDSFVAAFSGPEFDAWPLFDALAGLPVGLIRGANSDLLGEAVAQEMQRRRPDMAFASVPDRAHVPFLDEDESLGVIRAFLKACA